MDACIHYHPGTVNRVVWKTHCGSYWNVAFTFEASEPEKWKSPLARVGWYRGKPGALDALCLMYTTTKYTKEAIHPRTASWTITEFVTIAGQSTTNPPLISEIDYAFRAPSLKIQEKTHEFLRKNARLVAEACGCKVTERIVTKTLVGLFNRTIAELLDKELSSNWAPIYDEKAKEFRRKIQSNIGIEPMVDPFTDDCQRLLTPEEGENMLRKVLPEWVEHY